jgi:hypothetical protein
MNVIGKLFGALALLIPSVLWGGCPSLNVRDFGAVGDGVHDDTAALQKAAKAMWPEGHVEGLTVKDLRTRFVRSRTLDGAHGEMYFPKGVYRVTGPIVFSQSLNLRGEVGAVIRNESPDEVTFYFDHGFRMRVDNLSFEGGFTQMRQCTYNRTDASLFISRCSFSKATGPALVVDSWRINDSRPSEPDAKNMRACCPYEVSWTPEGRACLKPIPQEKLATWYSSTIVTVENCRFVDNVQAFALSSDGVIVRDCEVVADSTATGAAALVGGTSHLNRVKFLVKGRVASASRCVITCGRGTAFTDCTFKSEADVPAIECPQISCYRIIASQLYLKDVTVDIGRAPVIRFPEGKFPSMIVVDGLTSMQQGYRQPLFDFERAPTVEEVRRWPLENSKGQQTKSSLTDIRQCLGISVVNVDKSRFDDSLPASLEPFRREVPSDVRLRAKERLTYAMPIGSEVSDPTIGSRLCPKSGQDDTVAMKALFEKSCGLQAATVVLPAAWICLKEPIRLSGRVAVTVRGRAVITVDDANAAFRLEEGAEVVFDNVVFHRGANAVLCEGKSGKAYFRNCYFMDQARESISANRWSERDRGWRLEIAGGVIDTARFFRGAAAPLFMDGVWLTLAPDRPYCRHRPSYVCIENFEHGIIEAVDVLGVPRYFENREVASVTPGKIGDYRWFDNHGSLRVFNMRFGGERCGITPIYHYPGASTYVEGSYSYHKNNGHLRPGRAAAAVSSEKDDIRFVDVAGFNFMDDPSFYVGVQNKDGGYDHLVEGKVFNCYPYSKASSRH